MRILVLGVLWLIALVVDGVVFPSLLNVPSGFGTLVFLIALALGFGIHPWVIGWGTVAAFIAEILVGAHFGTLIGAWLAVAWAWQALTSFLSLKPSNESDSWLALAPLAAFGLLLFVIGTISEWVVLRLAYERALTFSIAGDIIGSPAILAMAGVELVALLSALRLMYASRTSFYG